MEYITDSVSMLFYHPSLQDSDQHIHVFEHACEKLHSDKNPSKKRNYTNFLQSLPENRSRGRVLFLFTDMIFCRKSHRIKSNKLKNLLELISNYSKVQDIRLIYQKKKSNCFPIHQQWSVGIWNKKHNIIYISTTKKKEVHKNKSKNNMHKMYIRRLNIVSMSILPNLICRFTQSQSKSQEVLL